ncbi:hypothetical protein N7456_005830 [Penicillium angulare]|uniref:Hydrophobin n=1 Tax=Penicillium angulare TaxID=116970 RepID=A0A9W9KJZ9_9EURO|nr:hypothetical protein N7456_005830 [Penicillium angulare]
MKIFSVILVTAMAAIASADCLPAGGVCAGSTEACCSGTCAENLDTKLHIGGFGLDVKLERLVARNCFELPGFNEKNRETGHILSLA